MELLFLLVWHLEDYWKPPQSEISFQLLLLLDSQRIAELKGIIEILLSHLHFVDENPRFREVGWISLVLEPFSDRTGTRDRVSWCPSPIAVPVLCVTYPFLSFFNKFWSFNQSGYCHLKGLSMGIMSLRHGLTYVNSPNLESTFQPCKCRNWTAPKQPGIAGSRNIPVKLLSYWCS